MQKRSAQAVTSVADSTGGLLVCSREKDSIVIGREGDCDLVIVDGRIASRHHCIVRHRGGCEKGAIAIGKPRQGAPEMVEFCYALVT